MSNGALAPGGGAAEIAPAPAVSLDYQKAHPQRGRTRRRWLALALLLGAAAWGGWSYRADLKSYSLQARYLYWQRQCLRYDPPANLVVYEEDPARAAVLLAQNSREYRCATTARGLMAGRGAVPTGFVPAVAQKLSDWVCLVMLGEMQTPAGEARLGLIGIQVFERPAGERRLEIYGSGKQLAGWEPKSEVQGCAKSILNLLLEPQDRLTLYAGRAVPGDPTRCEIRYTLNGGGGTIEGRMGVDDDVVLRVVDGPAQGKVIERPVAAVWQQ